MAEIKKPNLKGFLKGFATVSLMVVAVLSVIFVASFILTASASVTLTSNKAGFLANTTFDTNQTDITINFTISLGNMTGLGVPVQAIDINLSEAGFGNITAERIRCPDNVTSWTNSSPLTGILRCANTTGNTLEGNVQIMISNLSARSSSGTPTFNVSAKRNSSMLLENSSAVQVTLLELQASSSVNDTTSRIDEQRSYNFTVTNNATDPDNFDTIDEIIIAYTGSGFTDTGGSNVTCPKVPATTGVAWDRTNSSAVNTITCSKPAGTGSALGKGSSTNIVVNNWGASPRAGTLRFTIIVNGTNANGTYTVANESSPNVVVNGTINITGTSMTPVNAAVNRTNMTVIRYAFTTVGENFNVSVIKVTRAGTAADVDFKTVRLVNDTNKDSVLDSTDTPVFNASTTTTNGQYLFTGIGYRVTNNDTLFVVVDLNTSATAGRTFSFNINATSDVDSLGASSGANVSEVNASTLQSATGTVHGTLQATGYSLAPTSKAVNTANLAMAYFELNATGEGMNITVFNITRSGSAADADVLLVRLFNDTNNNAAFDSGTDTQLGAALNASASSMYKFTGFQFNITTTANSAHRIIVVANISSATAGRTFSFGLNNTGDISVVGATTAANLSIGSGNISFAGAQSGTTTIHGTLSVVGKALGANATAINSTGFSVLLLNFTAAGEQINVTQINLTRTGTAADVPGDIFNVTLYNDTDSSGTLTTGDLAIVGATGVNATTASAYLFRAISFNVTTAGRSVIVVVTTNETTTTGGSTFNLSINSTGSIWAFTASSNTNLTGSSNITLTTTEGNVTRIFGTLSIAGTDLTPTTANDGQLNVPILNLTLTAAGEQMNITQLNISLNNTNNDDVSAITLWNDTDRSGAINAGDYLIATATKTGSLAVFGTGTSQLLNVTAAADKRLIVAFNINSTATGGNLVDANLSIAANVPVTGSSSAVSITSSGLPINPVGETQITDLLATATIDFLNTKIIASDNYNFTAENTGGESVNSIMIDYTAAAFEDIAAITSVTCPTIAGGAWTRTINNATNTINCTSPGGANDLSVGSKANLTVKNFQAPISAGNKTFIVQVRGTSGGFFNATTNGVTVSGLLNVTGANAIASTIVVNSRNVSVIRYNFTASGEMMNISAIMLTRAGTSRESDIVSVKLFNDTDADGSYAATTDTTQIGSTLTANSTAAQYEFTGITFRVPTTTNNSLFAVVEVGNASTTVARTIILNLNATTDVNAIGATTAVNITKNLTGTASTASTIFGNLTITGTNLVNSTVNVGTETAVLRLNFTALGEGFNLSAINISVGGTATEANLTNVRLINDTNGNGIFDSSDTTIGYQLNTTTGVSFKFATTFQFNFTTSGVNTLFLVANTSTAVGTSGKTFNLSINGTGGVEVVGAVTATNLTETLVATSSNVATITGTFSVAGKSLVPATRQIGTASVSVLQLNLSATNEGMNISLIKLTRTGSANDNDAINVTLYNDTDLSGTFNAGDLRIGTTQNTTTSSKYEFLGINYNITTAAHTLFAVVSTNLSAGRTFGLSLASIEDINSIGTTSGANVTETLTSGASGNFTIYGNLTVRGTIVAPATKVVSTAGLRVMQFNFTPSGEGVNLTVLNITRTGSAVDGQIFNVSLFNDTDLSGTFNSGDTLIGSPLNTSASGQYVFTSLGYNVPTAGKTLFIVLTTNDTANVNFNFSLVAAGDSSAIGATSGLNYTGSSNTTLASTNGTQATTIHGTLAVTGSSLTATIVSITQQNFSVIRYNFTQSGENSIVSVLNFTRSGSAADADIDFVALWNDTDSSGTFNAADTLLGPVLNASASGVYKFTLLAYNVTPSRVNSLFLVVNVTSGATGGRTFNFTLAGTGDISAVGSSTGENLTGSANITRTSVESNTATIHGKLTATGKTLAPATAAVGAANITVLQINFSSTGEGFNISLINLTVNGSATEANLTNARLYVDTDATGTFSTASDTQLGSAVASASGKQIVFTGFQFNVSTGAVNNTIFVVVNTSAASGAGGTRFTISLNKTGDIQAIGAASNKNMTADANVTLTTPESSLTVLHGKMTFTGSNLVASSVFVSTGGISVLRLNVTPLGEAINLTSLNVTRGGNATDGQGILNVSLYNDTDASGTFTSGDTALDTVGVNVTAGSSYAFTGLGFNVPVAGKSLLLVVSTNDTADRTFNLALNGTGAVNAIGAASGENLTGSSNITLTSAGSSTSAILLLTVTGTSLAPATKAINSANITVLRLNFTVGGEGMNISVVRIARNESTLDADLSNVRLINDTNLNGAFDASDDQIGPTINATSGGEYIFGGLTYNIPSGGTKSLIVVVNTTAGTAGRTYRFNVNTTDFINTISQTTALNVTETLTTPVSARTTIHGTVALTGKVLNPDFVVISTSGIAVLQLNITPAGEGINLTVLNVTRTGSVSDVDGIFNVTVYNDTDASGTFNAGDTALGTVGVNVSASGMYTISGIGLNVPTGGKTLFIVATTNTSSSIGGKTFNLSLISRGDSSMIGATTGENFTSSTNITFTTTQSNTTSIFGTLAITSAHVANSSATFGTANLNIVRYNFSATGESMNISVIKITRSASANDTDIVNIRLFNDTNLNGVYDTSDTQIGSAVSSTTAGQYVFAGISYNITTAAHSLLVVVNTSGNAAGKIFRFNLNATADINSIGGGSAFNITETNSTTLQSSQVVIYGSLSLTGTSLVGGQGSDAPECSANSRKCMASNEANLAVARLNLSATGEGFNVTVIKLTRAGSSTLSDDNIENIRLINDTNGNGVYDSSDTTIGSGVSVSASNIYSFTGFQYNVSTSGVNTLFVVLNTTAKTGWDPQVYFNLSLTGAGNIDVIGALSNENVTETLASVQMNTTKITVNGWFNNTKVLVSGWNTDFFIPTQTVIETTGRNATNTGNFNFTSILSSLGSSWTHMYYNTNGSANGWVLATRSDFAGSTLQFVNNTNSNPYFINMTGADRFEL